MFELINAAKNLGSYSLANAAFAVLADKALDEETKLFFIWEEDSQAENKQDIYFDLLVISDGLREACIPAPLLKNPLAFRSICRAEREKREHCRINNILQKKLFNPDFLDKNILEAELQKIAEKINIFSASLKSICDKYLTSWNPSLDIQEAFDFQQRLAEIKNQIEEGIKIRKEKERLQEEVRREVEKKSQWAAALEQYWQHQIRHAELSPRLSELIRLFQAEISLEIKSDTSDRRYIKLGGKSFHVYDYPYIRKGRFSEEYELIFSCSHYFRIRSDASAQNLESLIRQAIQEEYFQERHNHGKTKAHIFLKKHLCIND